MSKKRTREETANNNDDYDEDWFHGEEEEDSGSESDYEIKPKQKRQATSKLDETEEERAERTVHNWAGGKSL